MYTGYIKWEDTKRQLENWLKVIELDDFGIIGGEPLLNPEIREWIVGVRSLMPDAQLRFTTNGLLLSKKFDIVDLLHEIGNCVFKITVHVDNKDLEDTINKIYKQYDFEPVNEHGINRFKTTNNFRFQVNRPKTFVKTYRNDYANMLPHDSNPIKSFDICVQQRCPLLYKGKIYKCSSIAMLNDTLTRFNKQDMGQWKEFVSYQGIAHDDDTANIQKFVDNFGKPESICKMCPTANDNESMIDHATS